MSRTALRAGHHLLAALVRLLPHGAARPAGARLGDLDRLLDSRSRRLAAAHIEVAYPELTAARRAALARASFRHLGEALCEALSAARFDAARLCRRVSLEGWEHLAAAESRGGGLILLTAHLGSFALLPRYVSLFHGDARVEGRALDLPPLARAQSPQRGGAGGPPRADREAAPPEKILRTGGRTLYFLDHRAAAGEGIEAPFFGRPAFFDGRPARLAQRTGAPAVPVFARPLPGGRYRLSAGPPIEPGGDGPEGPIEFTNRCAALLEREIRRRPEMWWWPLAGWSAR